VGLALGEQDQLEEALCCFEETLALERNSKDAWNNRAHCLLKLGRTDEAFSSCLKSLRIDFGFPLAWCTMGEIQESRGELGDARESYQQALELLTEESDLYGYVIERLGAIGERY
jgi:tetratricopeptide (TPR) repeat protein